MDDTANNLAETPELAQSDAPEAQPTEQPETDQSSDDAPDLDTQGTDPEFEEVEYEGKRYALPKELKDAILRQSDYTRKTQELAQQREQSTAEIAAEKARIEADRANFQAAARLVALDDRLQQFANVDWQALSQSDPVAAQQQFFQYQQLKDARGGLVAQIQQHESQRALQEREATARAMQQANEVLGREIKGWSPEVAKELRAVAKSLGADDKSVDSIREPWIVKALYAQKVLSEMTAKAQAKPPPPPAVPVKTVTGGPQKAVADPNKMSIDEYMRHERKRLARAGRL
jgi:hypothetical protein